jgi:asparagine synthase (glutamine-hydrolysing)
MCGISVLFHTNKLSPELYSDYLESLRLIDHRGPDDEGIVLINTKTGAYKVARSAIGQIDLQPGEWVESYNLALGHKRLSIVDLSAAGHQPMHDERGSWIIFNGEIYNYIELRKELKAKGYSFKTNSDTEVIMTAYKEWGEQCLGKFNGMWAIVLWDNERKKLFISNDRFGVKPLYYHEHEDRFMLFSETKQVSAYSNIPRRVNEQHLELFLESGYLDTDEETMYTDVYRFKKSHHLVLEPVAFKKGALRTEQKSYYTIRQDKMIISETDAVERLRYLLTDAVRIRMRADVDFAFAISGGLDSSAILYAARNVIRDEAKGSKLKGFASVFPGHKEADESEFVKIVANDLPCETTYCKAMDDFTMENFEKHIYHQDEPVNGTSFIAQWSVYRNVAQSGIKILMNGQGADEVFAGYHHHFYKYCRQLILAGKIKKYVNLAKQYAQLKGVERSAIHKTVTNEVKVRTKLKLSLAKFDNVLAGHWSRIDTLDEMLLRDFDTYQLPSYLRIDDRNSMCFSIESRHPFMDYRLVEFGYSLPNDLVMKDGWQKYLLRKSMHELPDAIRYRKDKKGFTTPHDIWISKYARELEEYVQYAKQLLPADKLSGNAYRNYALGAWLKVNKLTN